MTEERSAVVGDVRMRWLEEGEGDAVVFLHGIPTGPELWRHVMPLVGGARRLAWEMAGYAGSIAAGAGADVAQVLAAAASTSPRWPSGSPSIPGATSSSPLSTVASSA